MAVVPVTLADETFVVNTEMSTLEPSVVPLSCASNPVISPVCTVTSAQLILVPVVCVVGSLASPDVGTSCPFLPELSGILSSGLALNLEPQVDEADPPTSDEGGDEDESQPGGAGNIIL